MWFRSCLISEQRMRQALYGLLHYHYQLGAASRKESSRKGRAGQEEERGRKRSENMRKRCAWPKEVVDWSGYAHLGILMENVLFLKLPSEKDACTSLHDEHKNSKLTLQEGGYITWGICTHSGSWCPCFMNTSTSNHVNSSHSGDLQLASTERLLGCKY